MTRDPSDRPSWVLLVQRDEEDVLYEAAAMAAAAISLGIDVTIIWFDSALAALATGSLAETEGKIARAGRLLSEAREGGGLRFLACSASMVDLGADREAVANVVDDVVGWPTAISLIRSAERSFFF